MRESAIETAVCKFAKDNGILAMKLSGANQRGQPDRMFLKDGKVIFIEFKAPGKEARALQQRWLKKLKEHQFSTYVCDDIFFGKSTLRKFFFDL